MENHDPRTRRGYMILAGITLAALVIFNIDAVADLTRDRIDIVAILPEAAGVRIGSPVRVAGREAGRVLGIDFLEADDTAHVALQLRVDGEAATVLREDSDVRAIRLRVIGQPIIQLEAGSALAPPVHDGDTLRGRPRADPDALLARAKTLPAALDSLLRAARQVREMAGARTDDFARLQDQLDAIAQAANAFGEEMDGGSLQKLLEPGGLEAVGRLQARLAALGLAVDRARARYAAPPGSDGSDGSDAALPAAIDRLTRRVAALQRDLDALTGMLSSGRGILTRLPADSALQVALHALQAQIDTVRQEARSIVTRMVLP